MNKRILVSTFALTMVACGQKAPESAVTTATPATPNYPLMAARIFEAVEKARSPGKMNLCVVAQRFYMPEIGKTLHTGQMLRIDEQGKIMWLRTPASLEAKVANQLTNAPYRPFEDLAAVNGEPVVRCARAEESQPKF